MEKSKSSRKNARSAQTKKGAAPRASAAAEAKAPRAPLVITDSKTILRGTHAQAVSLMLEAGEAEDEGVILGAVGIPRMGKTYLAVELLEAIRARGIADRVLVHDVKKTEPQYEGAPCANQLAFEDAAESYDAEPIIVFHAADWLHRPSLQEVCEVAKALAEEQERVLVIADEVFKGTNGHQDWLKPPKGPAGESPALFPLFMREGSSQHVSTLWTTQIPQQLPVECQVLTQAVAQFHLENLAADAATEKFRVGKDGPQILRSLGRGEFILYLQSRDWDRTIYGPG